MNERSPFFQKRRHFALVSRKALPTKRCSSPTRESLQSARLVFTTYAPRSRHAPWPVNVKPKSWRR